MSDMKKTKEQLIEELQRLRASLSNAVSSESTPYQALFESAAEGILIADIATRRFVNANPAICRMLGYTREQLVGMSVKDIHPPESLDHVSQDFTAQARGQKAVVHELPCLKSDGTVFYADIAAGNVVLDGMPCAAGFFSDVTERRQAYNLAKLQCDLAVSLNSATNLNAALCQCLDTAIEASGMDSGGVYLVDATSGLELRCHKGLSHRFINTCAHYGAEAPNSKLVMSGTPVYETHLELTQELKLNNPPEGLRAIGVIPVLHAGQVIACLNIASHAADDITPDARRILEGIAAAIGSTVSRLKAEQALAATEARYHEIFSTVQEGIGIVDDNETILLANPAYARIFDEESVDAIIGRSLLEFLPDDQREMVRQQTEQRRANKSSKYELDIVTRKGNRKTLFVSVTPRFSSEGRYIGAVGAVLDITERKKAEEALRENRALLKSIADGATDAIYVKDLQGRYKFFNAAAESVVGKSAAEVLGKDDYAIFPSSEAAVVIEGDRKVIEGQSTKTYEEVVTDATGRSVTYLSTKGPMFDSSGQIIGLFGIARDITERKRIEVALQESEALLSTQFTNSPNTILIINRDYKIVLINKSPSSRFTVAELVGMDCIEVLPPETRDETRRRVAECFKNGEIQEFEHHLSNNIWVKACLVRIGNGSESDQVMIISTDITARKRAEEARRDSELRFRELAGLLPQTVYELDASGRLTYSNEHGFASTGYTQADIAAGLNALELVTPNDRERCAANMQQVLAGVRRGADEYTMHRKDGNAFPAIIYSAPILSDGRAVGIRGIVADITERKRAEEALREREEFLSSIIENIPDMIFIKDAKELNFVRFNKAGEELLGYKREDLIGKNDYDFFPREQADYFTRKDREVLEIGQLHEIPEEPIDTKHGKRILQTKKIPITDNHGKPMFLLGISQDITQRKHAEDTLKQLSNRHAALLASVPDIIMEVDSNKVYTWANKSGNDFFGDDVIGKEASHYFEGEQTTYQTVQPLFGGHEDVIYVESWQRRRDGEKRLLAWWCKVRKDTNGNVIGALSTARDITEQKRAAEALQIIGEEYRTLVNNVPVSIYRSTPEGRVLSANPASVRMMGYDSEEDYCAIPARDSYVDPHRRQEFLEELQKHGFVTDFESQMIRKDGKVIWASANATVSRNEKGDIEYIDGTEEDITERKHAEEALRIAEERYRLLFERAGEGILVAQDGKVIISNPAVTAISGYSPEELSRQPFTEFIHPGDRELVLDRHRRRLSGEDIPTGYDFRIVTRDGAIKTINIGSTMISWEDTPATLNFFADVTARRQAEEEIRKFKTISDNALYGTIIGAPDGTILYANRTMAQMHGYLPDEVVGRHISMFHTDRQMDAVQAIIREMLKTGGVPPTELWHLHRNGTEFPTLLIGTTIYDTAGQPQFLAASVIDTTELKHLQELADRAHRLEAAGRIAGQVAHDFNNLLGPLVAYPGLMREELGEGHPVNAYLQPMEAAAQQMAEINQQLLTLGRRGHYILEPLDLNEVIRQVLEQIQPQYPNLAVVADLAADLMNINGGVAQIARVVTNLITNAIDAMQGIGTLTITAENWYADETLGKYDQIARGEYAKVTISDTGCGVPEDILPHVFEPFFSTKKADRKRGSGLGLSVVHAVVEDHHGYIDIDSVVGRGTSILLYFPITRDEILHGDESIVSGGNESVLVVDDDATQRDVTLRLLQKLRYRAEAVDCGEAALQRLQFESFDLLILDMVMPGGLDGADTFKRAKELHLDQRAIIVSGFAESDRVAEALRIGAGSFIKKPLTLKSLAAAVRCELECERVIETVR